MKKLTYLMVAAVVLFMASCQKASEKSAGTYNGNYTVLGSDYTGNAVIATNADNTNWNMSIPSMSVTGVANGVTTTASGDNVTFSFTSSSTTDGDITSVAGTLTGNNLTFNFTVRAFGGNVAGNFSGSK